MWILGFLVSGRIFSIRTNILWSSAFDEHLMNKIWNWWTLFHRHDQDINFDVDLVRHEVLLRDAIHEVLSRAAVVHSWILILVSLRHVFAGYTWIFVVQELPNLSLENGCLSTSGVVTVHRHALRDKIIHTDLRWSVVEACMRAFVHPIWSRHTR